MSGMTLGSRQVFFSFCIDFFVDSVPRNSFTTVEPRYYAIFEQKKNRTSRIYKVFKRQAFLKIHFYHKSTNISNEWHINYS